MKSLMKFRLTNVLFVCIIALTFFSRCGCHKVPAGHVGIKVFLLGGKKGVDHEVLGVGRYWFGINQEFYKFPTFTQNYVWTKSKDEGSPNDESITFQTKEGLTVGADVGISYHIKQNGVSTVFQKYRKGIDEITDIYLRNMVRDAFNKKVSTLEIESVYGEGKAALLESVQDMVQGQVQEFGIAIEKIYLIGELRLPNSVVEALNAKIKATQIAQQRENEVKEAEANARKRVAEANGIAESVMVKAKAEAKAMQIKRQQVTQQLIQYEIAQKWDGKLPQFTGSGAVPLLNISK